MVSEKLAKVFFPKIFFFLSYFIFGKTYKANIQSKHTKQPYMANIQSKHTSKQTEANKLMQTKANKLKQTNAGKQTQANNASKQTQATTQELTMRGVYMVQLLIRSYLNPFRPARALHVQKICLDTVS